MSEGVGPVIGTERIDAIDKLRGIAVASILVMNIYMIAMPSPGYSNPLVRPGRMVVAITDLLETSAAKENRARLNSTFPAIPPVVLQRHIFALSACEVPDQLD